MLLFILNNMSSIIDITELILRPDVQRELSNGNVPVVLQELFNAIVNTTSQSPRVLSAENVQVFLQEIINTIISTVSPQKKTEFIMSLTKDLSFVEDPLFIQKFEEYIKERTKHHLGYPYNLDFNYEELSRFFKYSINNLGDPFNASNYGVHSRQFELEILDFFSKLWKLDDYWGYVTNSGTEGNLQSILVARENFPDGILYASSESHYSIFNFYFDNTLNI